jgi:hypothetical protein
MSRKKTAIALFAITAVGLALASEASARVGRGGGGGFHRGGGFHGGGGARFAGGGVRGVGRYGGGYYRGGVGRGLAAGAIAGAAIGAGYGGYYGYNGYSSGYYDDSYGYAAQGDAPVADDGYCVQRYRSYDPASGTYLGYDGLRHPCP